MFGSVARTVKLQAQFQLHFMTCVVLINSIQRKTALASTRNNPLICIALILPVNCKYQAEINGQEIK